jgi:hypothetical protein
MSISYEFSHSSLEVNPTKTLFSKKDEVEWGERGLGRAKRKKRKM